MDGPHILLKAISKKTKNYLQKHYGTKQLKEIEARFDGSRDAFSDYRVFKIASGHFDPWSFQIFQKVKLDLR